MQGPQNRAIQVLNGSEQDIDAILLNLENFFNTINCLEICHKSQATQANETLQGSFEKHQQLNPYELLSPYDI